MLKCNLELLQVDYERTIDSFLRRVDTDLREQKVSRKECLSVLGWRLILPVIKMARKHMSVSKQIELTGLMLGRFSPLLNELILKMLKTDPLGSCFELHELSFKAAVKGILVHSESVTLDEARLCELLGRQDPGEGGAAALLNEEAVQRTLSRSISEILQRESIVMRPGRMHFYEEAVKRSFLERKKKKERLRRKKSAEGKPKAHF